MSENAIKIGVFLILLGLMISVFFNFKLSYDTIPKREEVAFSKGKIEGDSIGFKRGHRKGALDIKSSVFLALNGSQYIFVDEKDKTDVPFESIVDNIYEKNTHINNSIDSLYLGMISNVSKYAELSNQENREVLNKYRADKPQLVSEFYKKYNAELANQNLVYSDDDYKKVEVFTRVMGDLVCNIVDLFTMPQKKIVFNKSILVGRRNPSRAANTYTLERHKKNTDSYLEDEITDEIVGNICGHIIGNSMGFLAHFFMDYANVRSFSEYMLVENVESSIVRKLTTTESKINVRFARKFSGGRWFGSTLVDFNATAIIAAGVDLDKKYKVDIIPTVFSGNNEVEIVVTLPNPEILSVEVMQNFNIINKSYYDKLRSNEINYLNNEARAMGKQEAINSGILERAKSESEKAIKQLFTPLIEKSRVKYKVTVKFEEYKFKN